MDKYTTKDFIASISVVDYISSYRNANQIEQLCCQCKNYGKNWGCPPFDFDVEARLRQFRNVLLIATQIKPNDNELPIESARELMLPERIRIENRLRQLETKVNGLSATHVGDCLHCPSDSCTRLIGKTCRHPEKVRPSLEAYGFDITKTTKDLFGIELRWSHDGQIPEYLLLVCGLFHNESIDFQTEFPDALINAK